MEEIYYNNQGNHLEIVLKVDRKAAQCWKNQERELREILNEQLEKRKTIKGYDRIVSEKQQYHFYQGKIDSLKSILNYCKDRRIRYQENLTLVSAVRKKFGIINVIKPKAQEKSVRINFPNLWEVEVPKIGGKKNEL
jgi:hypothetical protein